MLLAEGDVLRRGAGASPDQVLWHAGDGPHPEGRLWSKVHLRGLVRKYHYISLLSSVNNANIENNAFRNIYK